MSFTSRLRLYARLTRLDKPIGTLLLLWPTLSALWIASSGPPRFSLLMIFTIGTFLMRSAGCAVNDAADRNFDARVKRTEDRVVARGLVSRHEALVVAAVLCLLAALLLIPLNRLTWLLAVAAVGVAASYPLFKRFFPVPQLWLGIAFSFGVPMAFAAVLGRVPAVGWIYFFGNMAWVMAYDTEYAMVDRDDDLQIGLSSSAIFFGRGDVAAVMFSYGLHFALLLVVGALMYASWPYYCGWACAIAISVYHYFLIRSRSREGCFMAFRHNNWLGFAILAGIAANFALC